MRERPVRAQLYEANVRFGIEDRDWLVIAAVTLIPFVLLFLFDTVLIPLRVWRLPVYMLTTPLCLVSSVLFFRTIHIGKPPRWFEDHVEAFIGAPLERAPEPDEYEAEGWLIGATIEFPRYEAGGQTPSPVERLIRES